MKRPGRTTLDRDGNPAYRSRLMPREKAVRFARCLQHNRRVRSVEVDRSPHAAGPRCWFVLWLPSAASSREGIARWMQYRRDLRAENEGRGYQFYPDPDDPDLVYCISVSEQVYELSRNRCTCPDYRMRCARAGLRCKHLRAYEMRQSDDRYNHKTRHTVRHAA